MKKRILLLTIILGIILFCPEVMASTLCGHSGIKSVLRILGIVINAIKIVVPIILIVTAMIEFTKAVSSSDDRVQPFNVLVKKAIAAAAVFLVPTVVVLITNIVGSAVYDGFEECSDCISNPLSCEISDDRPSGNYNPNPPENDNNDTIPVTDDSDKETNDTQEPGDDDYPSDDSPGNNDSVPEEPEDPDVEEPEEDNDSYPSYCPKKGEDLLIAVGTWNIKRGDYATASELNKKLFSGGSYFNIVGLQESKPRNGSSSSLVASIAGLSGYDYFYTDVPAGNGIVSKYKIKSKNSYSLASCGEQRKLQKIVVDICGVTISFYNTHFSYQDGCPTKQAKSVNEIVKNDPNPVVLVGDFNVASSCYILRDNIPSLNLVASDNASSGCTDSILISDDIKFRSSRIIRTEYELTDNHNIVEAILKLN